TVVPERDSEDKNFSDEDLDEDSEDDGSSEYYSSELDSNSCSKSKNRSDEDNFISKKSTIYASDSKNVNDENYKNSESDNQLADLKNVSNEEETKIYTDGQTEIDEGNDVYDNIEALPRKEISDDFKSIKMFNQLLQNIIDYRSETSNFSEKSDEMKNSLMKELCEVIKNECSPTTESFFPSGSRLFIDTISEEQPSRHHDYSSDNPM
ncbi:hypothetical protein Anas_14630, partial [Armadillidium nasatum]